MSIHYPPTPPSIIRHDLEGRIADTGVLPRPHKVQYLFIILLRQLRARHSATRPCSHGNCLQSQFIYKQTDDLESHQAPTLEPFIGLIKSNVYSLFPKEHVKRLICIER